MDDGPERSAVNPVAPIPVSDHLVIRGELEILSPEGFDNKVGPISGWNPDY